MSNEHTEVIDNAIAAYQRGEISQADMLAIWRRAGVDAALDSLIIATCGGSEWTIPVNPDKTASVTWREIK
jgi:hypothetical protein